jgi:hypothetical protein
VVFEIADANAPVEIQEFRPKRDRHVGQRQSGARSCFHAINQEFDERH